MSKRPSLALIILAAQVSLLWGCGDNGTGARSTVVVFSDLHFTPYDDPALVDRLVDAGIGDWVSIFESSTHTGVPTYGGDTNYPLLKLALSSIQQSAAGTSMVVFTGDNLVHGFSEHYYGTYGSQDVAGMKAFANKTVAFVTGQVKAAASGVPVVFAVGNDDAYFDEGPDGEFLAGTAESFYGLLGGAADHQAFVSTFTDGGYYAAEPPGTGLRVLSLNSMMLTPAPAANEAGVQAELGWLDAQLTSTAASGKKAWILMHAPPGVSVGGSMGLLDGGQIPSAVMAWTPADQAQFLGILDAHPGVVSMLLAGHTHMDEFHVLGPTTAVQVSPSISPYMGNNPAYKVFTVAPDTMKATDFTSIGYDLSYLPEQFTPYYTFSTAYPAQGVVAASLAQLTPELATSAAKQTLFRRYFFSGSNAHNLITDANWPLFYCGIANLHEPAYVECVNGYQP
jgi:hypothetical protein